MKRLLFVVLILVVFAGVFSFQHFTSNDELQPLEDFEREEIVQDVNKETEREITELIRETHRILNSLTGFGSISKFSNPDEGIWVEAITRLESPLEQIEEQLEYVTEAIYNDLENFVFVTRYGLYEKDKQAIMYSHRIMHDLDVAINDYDSGVFGVTRYSSGPQWDGSAEQQSIDEMVQKAKALPVFSVDD